MCIFVSFFALLSAHALSLESELKRGRIDWQDIDYNTLCVAVYYYTLHDHCVKPSVIKYMMGGASQDDNELRVRLWYRATEAEKGNSPRFALRAFLH